MSYTTQVQEPTRNEYVEVGTDSVVISEARNEQNPRKVISIRNTGEVDVYVHFGYGPASTQGSGLLLKPNESVTDSSESGYSAWNGAISAIVSDDSSTLIIFER